LPKALDKAASHETPKSANKKSSSEDPFVFREILYGPFSIPFGNRRSPAYLIDWEPTNGEEWEPTWSKKKDISVSDLKKYEDEKKTWNVDTAEGSVKEIVYHSKDGFLVRWEEDGTGCEWISANHKAIKEEHRVAYKKKAQGWKVWDP